MTVGESQHGLDGLVEGQLVVDQRQRVVAMRGMVDATTLDHQEEALGRRGQVIQGRLGHLGEAGDGGAQDRVALPVELVGDVALAEQAEQPSGAAAGEQLGAVGGVRVTDLAISLEQAGSEIFRPAAEDDVDPAFEVLRRDLGLEFARRHRDREARGSGMGRRGGGDEADAFAGGHHLLR